MSTLESLEDVIAAILHLRKAFEALSAQVEERFEAVTRAFGEAQLMRKRVERHQTLINGDAQLGAVGLRERLDSTERSIVNMDTSIRADMQTINEGLRTELTKLSKSIQELQDQEKARQNQMKGVLWALTATGVTSGGGLLLSLARFLSGDGP